MTYFQFISYNCYVITSDRNKDFECTNRRSRRAVNDWLSCPSVSILVRTAFIVAMQQATGANQLSSLSLSLLSCNLPSILSEIVSKSVTKHSAYIMIHVWFTRYCTNGPQTSRDIVRSYMQPVCLSGAGETYKVKTADRDSRIDALSNENASMRNRLFVKVHLWEHSPLSC